MEARDAKASGLPLLTKQLLFPWKQKLRLSAEAKPCLSVSKVNGTVHRVVADVDTPLLYVLRNDLGLNGAKFGCGLGQCGACTVLVDGAALRSCVMPIGALTQSEIITLEGLHDMSNPTRCSLLSSGSRRCRCGYCIAGMIMMAKAVLDRNPHPSEDDVRLGLIGNLCRCGA